MKNYKIIFAIIIMMCLQACESTLLDQTNPNAITEDLFWETEDDFDLATNALYSSLQFPAVSGGDVALNMLKGDMAGTENWYASQVEMTNLSWNDATAFVEDRWSQLYIGIFRANQILHYLDEPNQLAEEDKTLYEAQARFLRALNYFWLVYTYNQAVIHDGLALTEEDRNKPLSTKEVVIAEMIIPDLEFAILNLPKQWDGDDNLGRFTWGAATSLLAKTYLYEEDWSNAAKYFKEVIAEADNGLYSLVPNFMDNFTEDNEFNSESILEVAFSDNYKEGTAGGVVDDINNISGSEATSIAISFASIYAGGYNNVLPTYWLQELFVSADSIDVSNSINTGKTYSQRTFATIAVEFGDGEYYNAPLSADRADGGKANFNYGQGSKVKKYTSWYYKDTEDVQTSARTGINFRHIRLADVYLMYAEAILENDGDAAINEALDYIDRVRERAGVITLSQYMNTHSNQIPILDRSKFPNQLNDYEYTTVNSESLLHHIKMVERPLELAFEGHRWYDLVRWGCVREVIDERRAEEIKLQDLLLVNGSIPSTSPKIYPLYLNERVRVDWMVPYNNYNPSTHDYFPIPSIETQTNTSL